MTTHYTTNGTIRALLTVRDPDAQDRAGALLDELDTLIAQLDEAIGEANAARMVIADAETEMAVIEASLLLGITESNAERRKAALTLALRDDPAYQTHAQAVRSARATLFGAERSVSLIKQRIHLVRAALAVWLGRDDART